MGAWVLINALWYKVVGDDTLKEMGKDWQGIGKSVAKDGGEEAVKAMGDLANDYAKTAIDAYILRRKSVAEFKKSLRELAEELSNEKIKPIFIIIDELDRCRPTYAIKLLEEVKHLFDVRGLVFVIALHGDQLAHSVRAVYGEGFDAKNYLQRFFSLTYRMREPTFHNIADYYYDRLKLPAEKMMAPSIMSDGIWGSKAPHVILGSMFDSMNISLRSAISILNGIRVFCNQWRYDFPFDVITVTYLIALQVTGAADDLSPTQIFKYSNNDEKYLSFQGLEQIREYYFGPAYLITKIQKIAKSGQGILSIVSGRSNIFDNNEEDRAINSYIANLLQHEERSIRLSASKIKQGILDRPSIISEYSNIVQNISHFFIDENDNNVIIF